MVTISLYYWAGAKAAAGVEMERFEAATVAEALRLARERRSDPHFDRVLEASSFLVDGLVTSGNNLENSLDQPVRVEVLPPFAGGAVQEAAQTSP
jgi:molybdopterin synthase sulfur carrier subunit